MSDLQKLDPAVAELAKGKNFGTLSFQLPSGRIASHVMWVDSDGEHLLINTEVDRAKYKAMVAHPQVTIAIWKSENPYAYAEVRGRVVGEVRGPEARAHIDTCSERYTGNKYGGEIKSERVIVKVAVERQRHQNL